MKKIYFWATVVFTSTFLFSCKKSDNSNDNNSNPLYAPTDSLHVSISTNTIENNTFDYAEVTVKNDNGLDITSTCTLLLNNGNTVINSKFVPSSTGTYQIKASRGSTPSNLATLNVLPNTTASPFTQKILVEDCTGAWCGYCPRVAFLLEDYKATHPNCITMAVHGGSSGVDPFKFQYFTSFNSHFSIAGYPTGIVNRNFEWSEEYSELDAALDKWAPLGISIESAINGNNITGTAKVKFNVSSVKPMKIVVAIVENGLVYPQTNYYAPTYGGDPITNFVHNGVLRKTATDLFGNVIPLSAEIKNNVWEFPFSFPFSGNTYSGTYNINPANCAIVAFVMDGSAAELGTYNVQYASAGTSVGFE